MKRFGFTLFSLLVATLGSASTPIDKFHGAKLFSCKNHPDSASMTVDIYLGLGTQDGLAIIETEGSNYALGGRIEFSLEGKILLNFGPPVHGEFQINELAPVIIDFDAKKIRWLGQDLDCVH